MSDALDIDSLERVANTLSEHWTLRGHATGRLEVHNDAGKRVCEPFSGVVGRFIANFDPVTVGRLIADSRERDQLAHDVRKLLKDLVGLERFRALRTRHNAEMQWRTTQLVIAESERDQLKERVAELDGTVTFLRGENAVAENDLRESTNETIEANTQKEEMQHARDCQYDDMVVYRDQLETKTAQAELWMRANEAAEEYFHACSVSRIDLDSLKSEWLRRTECARALDSATEAASETEGSKS